MLRITKLTDYAIIILGQMASVHGAIHTAADLAVTTGIAWPTVSKVLKSLALGPVSSLMAVTLMVLLLSGSEPPPGSTGCCAAPRRN